MTQTVCLADWVDEKIGRRAPATAAAASGRRFAFGNRVDRAGERVARAGGRGREPGVSARFFYSLALFRGAW